MCLEVPEGGCGQNRPGALRFPGGFPGRACSVWWGHPQEGSCCHPSRCILTLAQGCARDVSGDCDITGWRGFLGPLAGGLALALALTRWRTPRRTQQVSPLSWKAGQGSLGGLGVGWEPCLPGA